MSRRVVLTCRGCNFIIATREQQAQLFGWRFEDGKADALCPECVTPPLQRPGAARVGIGVGAGQGAAQLEPAHFDHSVAGEQDAVVGRDDVDVVQDRHRKREAAQLDRVRCVHGFDGTHARGR